MVKAELTHLEQELENLARRDADNAERLYYAKDWWSLSHNEAEEEAEQWEKVLEIRDKLGQYSALRTTARHHS